MREGKALDEDLVELEALNNLESVEVPDNDVSLYFIKVVRDRLSWQPIRVFIFNNAFQISSKKTEMRANHQVRVLQRLSSPWYLASTQFSSLMKIGYQRLTWNPM